MIFRTWSVGIGDVGDMHTDPASYQAVLGGIDSPALIVSTKYTLGDFYSWLPLNETLERAISAGSSSSRAGASSRTSARSRTTSAASTSGRCRRCSTSNPNIEGIWTWTQDGGPWRAGPMILYLKAGFWQLYELDTAGRRRARARP